MSVKLEITELPKTKELRAAEKFGNAVASGKVNKAKRIAKRHGISLRDQLDAVNAVLEGPMGYPYRIVIRNQNSAPNRHRFEFSISGGSIEQPHSMEPAPWFHKTAAITAYRRDLERQGAKSDSIITEVGGSVVILKENLRE